MAIRLRKAPSGEWIALCAASSRPKPGDVYIDDNQHYALGTYYAYEWSKNEASPECLGRCPLLAGDPRLLSAMAKELDGEPGHSCAEI